MKCKLFFSMITRVFWKRFILSWTYLRRFRDRAWGGAKLFLNAFTFVVYKTNYLRSLLIMIACRWTVYIRGRDQKSRFSSLLKCPVIRLGRWYVIDDSPGLGKTVFVVTAGSVVPLCIRADVVLNRRYRDHVDAVKHEHNTIRCNRSLATNAYL